MDRSSLGPGQDKMPPSLEEALIPRLASGRVAVTWPTSTPILATPHGTAPAPPPPDPSGRPADPPIRTTVTKPVYDSNYGANFVYAIP